MKEAKAGCLDVLKEATVRRNEEREQPFIKVKYIKEVSETSCAIHPISVKFSFYLITS